MSASAEMVRRRSSSEAEEEDVDAGVGRAQALGGPEGDGLAEAIDLDDVGRDAGGKGQAEIGEEDERQEGEQGEGAELPVALATGEVAEGGDELLARGEIGVGGAAHRASRAIWRPPGG